MDTQQAREVFEAAFGVWPEDPCAQELIDTKLRDNHHVIWKAIVGDNAEDYIKKIGLLWEAIYTLGLRQRPVTRVS